MLGSIDFMCFTRFDSPTVFASLLDARKEVSFRHQARSWTMWMSNRLYLPDTNVLLTRFLSAEGVAELTDFMPVKTEEKLCAGPECGGYAGQGSVPDALPAPV